MSRFRPHRRPLCTSSPLCSALSSCVSRSSSPTVCRLEIRLLLFLDLLELLLSVTVFAFVRNESCPRNTSLFIRDFFAQFG